MKRGRAKKPICEIKGWLLIILILCILSEISNFVVLIQKLIAIFNAQAQLGVYISALLLIAYCILMGITIFSIINKKKSAVRNYIITIVLGAIFLIWYYLLSSLIYHQFSPAQMLSNWMNVIVNIAITFGIAVYLVNSQSVKKTLTK